MNIIIQIKRIAFYTYLIFIIFMYTRPVSIERVLEETSGLYLDKSLHFLTFFFLGYLAQFNHKKSNQNIHLIILALSISFFIEFIHFIIPYRDFEILDGLFNIVGCTTSIVIMHFYRKKI